MLSRLVGMGQVELLTARSPFIFSLLGIFHTKAGEGTLQKATSIRAQGKMAPTLTTNHGQTNAEYELLLMVDGCELQLHYVVYA